MPSDNWMFFQAFLKSPRTVASIIPSSSLLERRVVRASVSKQTSVVVEFGAGTGGITRSLLQAMQPQARLLVIERTATFVQNLGRIDDDRLEVVHGCASEIGAALNRCGYTAADVVVSGIPFSTLPKDVAENIVSAVHEMLAPGGKFVAYQVTDRVVDYAAPIMGAPAVEYELCNVPPMRVFTWHKSATSRAAANGNGA